MAGLNRIMGFQPSRLCNGILNDNTDINKHKRPHTMTKKNDNIHMYSTIAVLMDACI
jgi:hypothetical protein